MQRVRGSFWLPSGAVAYVCFAAIQGGGATTAWLALLVLPLAVAHVFQRTSHRDLPADGARTFSRRVSRACAFGTSLWLAARSGPAGHAAFDAAANLGAGITCVAALLGLARIDASGGMLQPHPRTRSFDAAGFAAVFWSIAVALPGARALFGTEVRVDPLSIDYATTTAAIAGLLVLAAASFRLRMLRRLELGVADRARGAFTLAMTAICVGIPAAALDVAPPDRILPFAGLCAALACTWAASTPDPTRVASALRGTVALAILGAPVVTAASLLARGAPQHAPAIVFAACSVAVAIGVAARAAARPLGPEQSRWLDAIEAASQSALEPEPEAAMRAALHGLAGTSNVPGSRPELWRNDPEQVLRVDLAGYLHVENASAPERLYEFAALEPERTLRSETLRALEVRRPELRPLLAWFDARRAFSATLIVDVDGPLGFILLPAGNRTLPMTLEEARGVRLLADRMTALFAVLSALARSRERELSAVRRADEVDDERQRLLHVVHHELERRTAHAERLVQRLRNTAYSPAAQMTLERVERLGRLEARAALFTPPGVRAEPWAAALHLASGRNRGSLFAIDGTSCPEHDLQSWTDPKTSPFVQAEGGTLLVLDAPALPSAIQDYIAQSLSRRTTHTSAGMAPPGLILTTRAPLADLLDTGRLTRALGRWIGDSEIILPSLLERAEDLRALILDCLARTGLAMHGEPLGIEPHALRLLMDAPWPGNELELESLLTRAATCAEGRSVSLGDLARAGFESGTEPTTTLTASAGALRSRRPQRRAPRAR